MNAKKVLAIIGVCLGGIIVILGMLRIIYGGPEDVWTCGNNGWERHGNPREPMPEGGCDVVVNQQEATSSTVGIANPASQYCLEQNGDLEFKQGENGIYAMCNFPDGRSCEEWEFFRTKKCGEKDVIPPTSGEMEKFPMY